MGFLIVFVELVRAMARVQEGASLFRYMNVRGKESSVLRGFGRSVILPLSLSLIDHADHLSSGSC